MMFFGQSFPKSEASQKGLKLGEMFKDVGILGGAVACFLIAEFFRTLLTPMLADAEDGKVRHPNAVIRQDLFGQRLVMRQ